MHRQVSYNTYQLSSYVYFFPSFMQMGRWLAVLNVFGIYSFFFFFGGMGVGVNVFAFVVPS